MSDSPMKKMSQTVSVIVPVYNVEKYLHECVDSILNQTYQNLEVILVDDGSTDNSGTICDIYEKDERVRVIHKKNGGLGAARNAGIDLASGEYLLFVDSDDALFPDCVKELVQGMQKYDADAAICGFACYDGTEIRQTINPVKEAEVITGKEVSHRYFDSYEQSLFYTVAWNKLYKKELFASKRYVEGRLHEDEDLTLRLLFDVQRIVLLPSLGYKYRIARDNSIMKKFTEKRFELFDAYMTRMNFYAERGERELWSKTLVRSLHMFEQYVQWQREACPRSSKVVHVYRGKLVSCANREKQWMSKKLRIEYDMSRYLPAVYHMLWKLKHGAHPEKER